MQLGKRWDKVHRAYNKGVKVSERSLYSFDNIVPTLNTFRKLTSIRITIGSGLKHVATGSVWNRYQITLFAQFSENFTQKCKHRPQGFNLRETFGATSWVRMV